MNDDLELARGSNPLRRSHPPGGRRPDDPVPSLPDVPLRARDADRRHPEVRRRVPGAFGVRR